MALTWEDNTTLALRALFEQYGYRHYHMGKFEPYDLYLENRNFLQSDTVITFPDAKGRLMALKPDVTMSIVKSTAAEDTLRKLYYSENVFRMASGSSEYKEIHQIGVEYIGGADGYSEAETVLLAMKSLEIISPDYLLTAGHMGFVTAMLRQFGLPESIHQQAIDALAHKNAHELTALCEQAGVSPAGQTLLQRVLSISHPAKEALAILRELSLEDEMASALYELERLYKVLAGAGCGDRLRIDFSTVNDTDYYNGIVFQGFISGLPQYVLSGGRYDNLLRRFGKPQSAIGYAIYFGELNRHFREKRDLDADVLLLYGGTPAVRVMEAVQSLIAQGSSVLSARSRPAGIRVGRVLTFDENGQLREVEPT